MITSDTFTGDYNFIAGEQDDVGNMSQLLTLRD